MIIFWVYSDGQDEDWAAEKMIKREKFARFSSSPSYFCSLKNGGDILLRSRGWQSGRGEGDYPNLKNTSGNTPFMFACYCGNTSCVCLLLQDHRVKVNEPNNDGETPLFWAASRCHLGIIRWWIASGREMNLGTPGEVDKTDAIGVAKEEEGKTEVVSLLERFKSDATQTRHAVRVELGLLDELAAEMFAVVVFVSDGLLQVSNGDQSTAARFFSIARRLPLELQMVLCRRVVGSDKEIIRGKDSEVAFKELARGL